MGNLVVTEFMSLDGAVEDPAGEWVTRFEQGTEAGEFKFKETLDSECMLLGRVTYEGFARSWPQEQGEFADTFNALPKYVVSSTLQDPSWKNTTVLGADVARRYPARVACSRPGAARRVSGLTPHAARPTPSARPRILHSCEECAWRRNEPSELSRRSRPPVCWPPASRSR